MLKIKIFLLCLIFICYTIPLLGGDRMEIFSNSFKNNQYIPLKYSCEGKDISPHLKWKNIPEKTESLVLIVDDPDAPVGTWVHWVVYNIPPDINEFAENVDLSKNTIKQGLNDFGKLNYGGPCPPHGKPHRYFFKLYAVDIPTDFREGLSKKEILKKISNNIIEQVEIIGLFKR